MHVAALLQAILPAGPRQVSGPLRYTVARGLSAVEGPPYESLQAFSASLARFEAGDRRGTIRALLQRIVRTEPITASPTLDTPAPATAVASVPPPGPVPGDDVLADVPLVKPIQWPCRHRRLATSRRGPRRSSPSPRRSSPA